MIPMNDDHLLCVHVDFARVEGAWPQHRSAQNDLLKNIGANEWHRSCLTKVHCHVTRHGHRRIDRLTLDLGFGGRWFEVWGDNSGSQLVVIKRQAPKTPVVVEVELQAHPEGIGAAFSLMSGRVLGTTMFADISAETPLFVKQLREAASERARLHGLLETHRQRVNLTLPGFASDPPNGLLLWARPEANADELDAWLALVRPLSPTQLAACSLAPSSDEDTSSEDLDDSDCSWVFEANSEEESTESEEASQQQV